MAEGKLKTAVLGLDEQGKFLLGSAQRSGYFQIQAVADKNGEAANTAAREYGCTAYDDYRQLITQNQFDCLLVAAGIHSCDEYLRMAMKKKINVLKLIPAGRNFEEAAQFVRLAETENVKFAIGTTGRFAESFLTLQRFIKYQDLNKERKQAETEDNSMNAWEPYLVTAYCATTGENLDSWRMDPKLAGGGVLLYDCYEIIDQIVINFGLPQKVYALTGNTTGDKQQRLYLTENMAVLTMKFTDALFVNLLASNSFGPAKKELCFYSNENIAVATNNELLISGNCRQKDVKLNYNDDSEVRMKRLLENFALAIQSPGNTKLLTSGKENLKTMAVIEAAYLSAKTGFPEEPVRILEMQKLGL